MKKEILEALKQSIKKWKLIVEEKGNDSGVGDCALCALFNYGCNCSDGCPVCSEVGIPGCVETPYEKWGDHHTQTVDHTNYVHGLMCRWIECDKCKSLAIEELNFLRSLLPEGERDE